MAFLRSSVLVFIAVALHKDQNAGFMSRNAVYIGVKKSFRHSIPFGCGRGRDGGGGGLLALFMWGVNPMTSRNNDSPLYELQSMTSSNYCTQSYNT